MDRSLFIFTAVGVVFLYFITDFIGDIQKNDERYRSSEYEQKHQFEKYIGKDAVGQEILIVEGEDEKRQLSAWHASALKMEFLEIFPDYDYMRQFVQERIKGKLLQKKLLEVIERVEGEFLSGTLSAQEARKMLESVK